MKIICDNCRTKYSIADEKVKGKVFKIRCKKCSNIIVVHGTQAEDSTASAKNESDDYAGVGDCKDTPVWHLVINQQQVGPMTSGEIRQRLAHGEIDPETYIWREGFTDWIRLNQVEEFADTATVASSGSSAYDQSAGGTNVQQWGENEGHVGIADRTIGDDEIAPSASSTNGWNNDTAKAWGASEQPSASAWGTSGGETNRAQQSNLFGGAPRNDDPGKDLFATNQGQEYPGGAQPVRGGSANHQAVMHSQGVGNLFEGNPPAAVEGSDLFGGDAPNGGGNQLFPPEEADPAAPQMTATRNENSVLFSLNNLQALAMGTPPSPNARPSAASGSPADGSGLIDIRSMAGGSAPGSNAKSGDALPNLGGFSAPLAAAPVLMPYADDRKKWLLPTIIGGSAILIIAVIILVVVLVTNKPSSTVVVAPPDQPGAVGANTATPLGGEVGTPKGANAGANTATDPSAGADPSAGQAAAGTENQPGASSSRAEDNGRRRRDGQRRRRRRDHQSAAASSTAPSSPPASSDRPKKKPSRKRDALDDLIDGAVGKRGSSGRPRPKPTASASKSNLPQTLSRADIQNGMRGIKGRVQGCYDRYKVPGLANVQVKIGSNGRISSAQVRGMFAGTPTGACVQAAAKSARFKKFSGPSITIT